MGQQRVQGDDHLLGSPARGGCVHWVCHMKIWDTSKPKGTTTFYVYPLYVIHPSTSTECRSRLGARQAEGEIKPCQAQDIPSGPSQLHRSSLAPRLRARHPCSFPQHKWHSAYSAHASDSPRESGESKGTPTLQFGPSPRSTPDHPTSPDLDSSRRTLSASCGSFDGDNNDSSSKPNMAPTQQRLRFAGPRCCA